MSDLLAFFYEPAAGVPGWLILLLFLSLFGLIGFLVWRSFFQGRRIIGDAVPRPLLDPPVARDDEELQQDLRVEEGLLGTMGGADPLLAAERLARVAALYAALGQSDDATLYRQAAVSRMAGSNQPEPRIALQIALGEYCLERHLLDEAGHWFDRAQREAERRGTPDQLTQAAGGAALVEYWRGSNREALMRVMVAQLALGERGFHARRAWLLEIRGAIDAALGRVEPARRAYRKAARLYRLLGRPDYAAPVHRATGDLYHHMGDIPGACAEWALARDLYARTGDDEMARRLDRRINRLSHRGL